MVRLIVNGKAAGSPELRAAVSHMRGQGTEIEVRVTWESGDAARYAQQASKDQVDIIVAAGGDGTINEVVDGLMRMSGEPSVAVGVIPFGTANDFANGCGIPLGDPLAALQTDRVYETGAYRCRLLQRPLFHQRRLWWIRRRSNQ